MTKNDFIAQFVIHHSELNQNGNYADAVIKTAEDAAKRLEITGPIFDSWEEERTRYMMNKEGYNGAYPIYIKEYRA